MKTNDEPRPVVKQIRFAPPATGGDGDRVIAGGVHKHEALGGHRLPVFVDLHHVGGSGLGDATKRFLQHCRQAARLVAGGWVVVHLRLGAGTILFPPGEAAEEFLADLR
jgi:hypothetical protein